jgi:hypothetical protein
MYILQNGTETTADAIKAAFESGNAVLSHYRLNNGNTGTSLRIDGKHFDTRGECYSMRDESWTSKPKTVRAALYAALVKF